MQLDIHNPDDAEDILAPLKAVDAKADDGYTVEVAESQSDSASRAASSENSQKVAGVTHEAQTLRVFVADDWDDRVEETHVVLRDENGNLIERTTPEQIATVIWKRESP